VNDRVLHWPARSRRPDRIGLLKPTPSGVLQRRAVSDGHTMAPPIVHDVLRSPGRPLDDATRGFMESRFNHDFSGVRIHTDGRAAESARAVNALAYTVGNHVAFDTGQYAPGTSGGRGLVAHELAHVIQQGTASVTDELRVSQPVGASEHEAKLISHRVLHNRPFPVTTERSPHVARQAADAGTGAPAALPPTSTSTDAGEPEATCALTTFTASNFTGEKVVADVEFVDSLNSINAHAAANKVNVYVTSSFRTSTTVPGAVVTPAEMSNHLAGHAIDMNVQHGEQMASFCNSTCLGGELPDGVSGFIKAIQDDSGLRWGGDFTDKDPVHIDDNLNSDSAAWKARNKATQKARTDKCG